MKLSIRRIVSMMTAMILLSSIGVAAYYQTFTPPKRGSGRVIEAQIADGNFSPYVQPNVNTQVETVYVLTTSSVYIYGNFASSLVATKVAGRFDLVYNAGYGGAGTRVYLQGAPYAENFSTYSVSGTWNA